MATLSVLKFDDPYGADRVLVALQGMQERQMITLEGAAVVSWPQGNRKPTTHQLHSTAGAGAFWGLPVRADLLRALPRGGDRRRYGRTHRFVGRRWNRRQLHKAGAREGHGGNLCALRAHQWGDRAGQGHRRAKALRLRDHLDQPARGAGEAPSRGLRQRVVRAEIALERSSDWPLQSEKGAPTRRDSDP
jgi:hypothetical protein